MTPSRRDDRLNMTPRPIQNKLNTLWKVLLGDPSPDDYRPRFRTRGTATDADRLRGCFVLSGA
jgi:hypothetical protein